MSNRRGFLLQALSISAMLTYNKFSIAQSISSQKNTLNQYVQYPDLSGFSKEQILEKGTLLIPSYVPDRLPLDNSHKSILIKINPTTDKVEYMPSVVRNLHGLAEATSNNPNRVKIGIGFDGNSDILDFYDSNFNFIKNRTYPEYSFRGHGVIHEGDILVTAEAQNDFKSDGFLLLMDSEGNIKKKVSSGGRRPHEIVDCGKYYAIAHYGDSPLFMRNNMTPSPQTNTNGKIDPKTTMLIGGTPIPLEEMGKSDRTINQGLTTVDNCQLAPIFDITTPGVSFINKADLSVHSFFQLPNIGRTTHLAVTENGDVIAMGINAFRGAPHQLRECSLVNKVNLLNIELSSNIWEAYVPMYQLNADKGIVDTISAPMQEMRRGQSFTYDPLLNIVVGTFSASQEIFIRKPGSKDSFLSTLKYGVTDPRGCTMIPGTGWVAVSSNSDNVAIIDVVNEKLVKLIGVTLGQHSHCFWWM